MRTLPGAVYRGRADAASYAALGAMSDGFSGSECEQAVVTAGFAAFADGAKRVEAQHVESAVKATTPLSRTAPEDFAAIEKWAAGRSRFASSGS